MKLSKISLYVVLVALQAYLIRFGIGGYPTNLQEILIGITAIIFIIETIRGKRLLQVIKNIKNHWIILTFLFLTGISLANLEIGSYLDLIRHLKFLFFGIATVFIFLETFRTPKERKKAIFIGGLGALAFGLFSVIYNLLGYNIAHDLRLLGPLDAAVYLAFYLTPFFIFFAIQSIHKPKPKYLIPAILLALLILTTRSMGSIGAGFLVVAIYFIKNSKIFRLKYVKIALAAAAIIVIGAIFYTKILPTLQTPWSSLHERGEIWQTSAYLLQEPRNALFGVGIGQFQYYYENTVAEVLGSEPLDYYVLQPHNIFLLFIFQYGLLGLAFILFCIYKTVRNLKSPYAFILLYFFIHGLIDTPFFKNDLLILFILFLEMGLTHPKPETKSIKTA